MTFIFMLYASGKNKVTGKSGWKRKWNKRARVKTVGGRGTKEETDGRGSRDVGKDGWRTVWKLSLTEMESASMQ